MKSSSRNFRLVSSNPKISQTGEEYGLQGRQYRTTFHITRSQADVRRIVLIAFVIMGIIIKGEEVLILPFVPTHPAPSLTFPRARKRSIECGPPNRKWSWCFSRCRCLLLNKSSYGICRSRWGGFDINICANPPGPKPDISTCSKKINWMRPPKS